MQKLKIILFQKEIMQKFIKRLLETGMDLSTKSAVKTALGVLNMKGDLADDVFVKIKNELNREEFSKVPYDKRALFLPHCLRHAKLCEARVNGVGYECRECGRCKIYGLKKEAEKLGYKVYIVPGGSMVFKILKKTKPKAVAGVACYFELEQAIEKLSRAGIPHLSVPLSKDGCKNTKVDVKSVMDILKENN